MIFLCESRRCIVHDVDERMDTLRELQQRLGDLSLHVCHVTIRVKQSWSVDDMDAAAI